MLLLDVWRDATGPDPLEVAIERIGLRVSREFPLAGLVMRRFEAERLRLETVAACWLDPAVTPGSVRQELGTAEFNGLVDWSLRIGCGRLHGGGRGRCSIRRLRGRRRRRRPGT